MAKNILVCCDGTNNQFSGDHTNVIRTFKVAERDDGQVTFYDPGVGTMPEPWAATQLGRRWSMIEGLAFGSGFLDNVADAYRFLMRTYAPGDRVYLFGFSRGAYTARALAGMLHSVGLLHPGSENLVPYAVRYWRQDRGGTAPGSAVCREFKETMARPCPVHFIGVWDTVGSVGFINHFRTFPHTLRNPEVAHVRHAVSIDERRKCFRQNLMAPATPEQDVLNVWFAGVHSDVGGGYPAFEAGLAKEAFAWMMDEAARCGMRVSAGALHRELDAGGSLPNPCGIIHRSLTGLWWLVELIPDRRYSFADHRLHWHLFDIAKPRDVRATAHEGFVAVHASVIERFKRMPGYAPPNLTAAEAAGMKVVGSATTPAAPVPG